MNTQPQGHEFALALYATTERPAADTRNWYHIEADWRLLWVLPPLTAAQKTEMALLGVRRGSITDQQGVTA